MSFFSSELIDYQQNDFSILIPIKYSNYCSKYILGMYPIEKNTGTKI